MDKPKMPSEMMESFHTDSTMRTIVVKSFTEYDVRAHHAEWEAYVSDMAEELDATIDQRDLLSREVLRLEARLREVGGVVKKLDDAALELVAQIEELVNGLPNKWISVRDRMPPADTIVPTIKRHKKAAGGFSYSYGSWNTRGSFCDKDAAMFKRDADYWYELPPFPTASEGERRE